MIRKISRESHNLTVEKWEDICERTKKETFLNEKGFLRRKVIGSCAYCKELGSDCFKCSLKELRICQNEYSKSYIFWRYIDEMHKTFSRIGEKVDREKAITLSEQILEGIKNDEYIE